MCRMLIARGQHDRTILAQAAKAMATGERAPRGARVRAHSDGWGIAHRPFSKAAITVHRDLRPLAEADMSLFAQLGAGLTLIHARHATRPWTIGRDFTHPLERDGLVFCHNGFAPNAAVRLGRGADSFDTRALFDWLAPPGAGLPQARDVAERLGNLGAGASSANCFLVSAEAAIVVNWFEIEPDFYTLWRLDDECGQVFASEILPELAPADRWRPLGHGTVLHLPIEGEAS